MSKLQGPGREAGVHTPENASSREAAPAFRKECTNLVATYPQLAVRKSGLPPRLSINDNQVVLKTFGSSIPVQKRKNYFLENRS